MRKEFKAIIAAILAVWLFLMGFEIGSYYEKQVIRKELATSPAVEQTTQAPEESTTAPAAQPETPVTAPTETVPSPSIGNALSVITTYPDSELSAGTTAKSPASTTKNADAATTSVDSLSKAQILQNVTKAVNKLKSTKNMTARNQETISIQIVDCSAKSAISLINSVISKKIGDKNVTYVFKDGKAVGHDDNGKEIEDEGEVTPNHVLPPADASFALPESGVASASAAQNGAFVTYTIKIKEESSSINDPVPSYNSKAVGYLKMSDMEVPGATITDANMHYLGTTVTVTIDGEGRVRQLQTNLPMEGSGSAKMGFLSGSASFEGYSAQNWTFTY